MFEGCNDKYVHHNLRQIPSVYIVSDDKYSYDNLQQIVSIYTLYNNNFIR